MLFGSWTAQKNKGQNNKGFWIFNRKFLILVSLLLGLLSLGSCQEKQIIEEHIPLDRCFRIGIVNTRGALPIVMAKERGYYREEGACVEIISFASVAARNQALKEGMIDAMVADLVSTTLLFAKGEPLSVVALVSGGAEQQGRVAIVASPDSDLQSFSDLQGKELALSEQTLVAFAADKLLQEANISIDAVNFRSVPNISERLQMLLDNKVDAACLPDPMITYAQTKGARVLLDDRESGHCCIVLAVREEMMRKREDVIERVLIAMNRSVVDINTQPAYFRRELLQLAGLPVDAKSAVRVCRFSSWRVPTRGQFAEVLAWLHLRRLIFEDVAYEHVISSEFVERENMRCAHMWEQMQESGRIAVLHRGY